MSAASLAARSRMMGKKVKQEQVLDDEDEEDEDGEDQDENGAGPGPSSARSRKRQARTAGQDDDEGDEDEGANADADEDEDMDGDGGHDVDNDSSTSTKPSPFPTGPVSDKPPRILLTTSPGSTQLTHAFMAELRSVLPGGEVYKRLKGRGFEIGRIARWAAKREFKAMVVVNEDHKMPSESVGLRRCSITTSSCSSVAPPAQTPSP
jgi:ribosome production factor 1